jgi:hypothetical protein
MSDFLAITAQAVLLHQCDKDIALGMPNGNIVFISLEKVELIHSYNWVVAMLESNDLTSFRGLPDAIPDIDYERIETKSIQIHGETVYIGYGPRSERWVMKV